MYAIKVSKSKRYISYCDKCWYETTKEPLYIYSYEKAQEIAKQMREHYVYCVEIVSKDGSIEIVDTFNKNPMAIPQPIVKKSFAKIRIRF